MKVSAHTSTPGIGPGKVMLYMGVTFVVIGAVVSLSLLGMALSLGMPEMTIFTVIFAAVFCGVGGLFAKLGYDSVHASDEVLSEGAAYLGKIYAHEPDYQVTMNGQPCVTLVVRYMVGGQICEARVNTGECDATRYPRGATVSIKIHEGVAALVPDSVDDMHIEREDDLMNPDFDPGNTKPSIGVSCPNCGANIVVPLSMSRFCPYCNSKVSVTPDGRVVG